MREEARLALLFFLCIPMLFVGGCRVSAEFDQGRALAKIDAWSGSGVAIGVVERAMYETDQLLAIRLDSPRPLGIPPGMVKRESPDTEHLRGRAQAAGVDVGAGSAMLTGEFALREGGFCHPFPCNASMVVAADGRVGYLVISGI